MTMTPCPKCGEEIHDSRILHQDRSSCLARQEAVAAVAEGLTRVADTYKRVFVEEEIAEPLRRMGLVEPRLTHARGRRYFQRLADDADHEERVAEEWVPVWAVMAATDALAAGDEIETAVHAYRMAVRECPDVANSMLGDERLLNKE